MLRLTLVCSGITEAMKRGAFPTSNDAELEPHSITLAEGLRPRLKGADAVFAGTDMRAHQTARLLGLAGRGKADLREQDYGAWAGHSLKELQDDSPQALADWISDPDFAPQAGESLIAVSRRVEHFLGEMERQSGHIVAVTYPAVARCAVLHVLGAPISSFWRLDASPLSLTDLRHDGTRWALRSHGAADF